MNIILEIDNITIEYDKKCVLRNFSMSIERGTSVAVIGASGCGKSSLLKAVIGIVPMSSGSIKLDGVVLSPQSVNEYRHRIAYLPQELTFPCEWIREIVELTLNLRANRGCENREVLLDYFGMLGLEKEILEKRLSEISGGQRQRVMIAIAALLRKDIILLDEPTSALDSESTHKVFDFLTNLKYRPTIIAVTHDKIFAQMCNKNINICDYANN